MDMNQFSCKATGNGTPPGHNGHEHPVALTLLSFGEPVVVGAFLCYHTADPIAVTVSFSTSTRVPIDWVFARDLLAEGMVASAGKGDIRIRPSDQEDRLVMFHLETPSGSADFSANRDQLDGFLKCTAELVPFGHEAKWLDIDSSITRLLADE
ncbi:SsgA family sporulation/cell division regulator [Amycolatopsis speibonae]|uniref:SsgA family sporulation/cell division regulator n=1 Tax=Amycolatopsis speibonae TaxID=1450224 RepID=A0ABV7P269_9PSEU